MSDKNTDKNEIQCYVAATPDNSQMFGMAVTLEKLAEAIKERFDLDDEEFASFKEENRIEARPIRGVPVKNIVEIEHRSILASEQTMQNLIYDSYEAREKIDIVENYESMAELVQKAFVENEMKGKPTPEIALQILKSELDDDHIVQPKYPMNERTYNNDTNYLVFSDGSRLNMKNSNLIAEPNIEERIERIQKEYRHKFAQELTADVRMYRDPEIELSASRRMRA